MGMGRVVLDMVKALSFIYWWLEEIESSLSTLAKLKF